MGERKSFLKRICVQRQGICYLHFVPFVTMLTSMELIFKIRTLLPIVAHKMPECFKHLWSVYIDANCAFTRLTQRLAERSNHMSFNIALLNGVGLVHLIINSEAITKVLSWSVCWIIAYKKFFVSSATSWKCLIKPSSLLVWLVLGAYELGRCRNEAQRETWWVLSGSW